MDRLRELRRGRLAEHALHQLVCRRDVEGTYVHDTCGAECRERALHAAQRRLSIDGPWFRIVVRAEDKNPFGGDLPRREMQQLER